MSNSNSTSTSSSSYIVSSSSSSSATTNGTSNGTHHSGHRAVQQSYTGPDGQTITTSATQNLGAPVIQQTRRYDDQGRDLLDGPQSQGRIQDVSEGDAAQAARDREYEERMEEEYAKREGGA